MPETFEPFPMTASREPSSSFEELKSDSPIESAAETEEPKEQTAPPLSSGSNSDPAQNASDVPQHQASDTPKLFVDREEGRIVRIRVLCSCGLSTTLKCNYEATPAEVSQPQGKENPATSFPAPAAPLPSSEGANA